jgi:hypothetical protein
MKNILLIIINILTNTIIWKNVILEKIGENNYRIWSSYERERWTDMNTGPRKRSPKIAQSGEAEGREWNRAASVFGSFYTKQLLISAIGLTISAASMGVPGTSITRLMPRL